MSLFALGVAVMQARSAWRANKIPVLLGFLREHRELLPQRRYVLRDLKDEVPETTVGVRDLPAGVASQVEPVVHYLDHLGFAWDSKLLTVEQIEGYMGGSVRRSWQALQQYVDAQCAQPDSDGYASYFRALTAELDRRAAQRAEAIKRKAARRAQGWR